jgi:hypothetical protein
MPPTEQTSRDRQEPNALPRPDDEADRGHVVWRQLEASYTWYDQAAIRARRAYVLLKGLTLFVAAAVPVLAALDAAPWLTATAAAVVVVSEGLQQLFQLQANWISYRSAAEALRREGFRFAAGLPPYQDEGTRRTVLGTALAELATREGAAWSTTMSRPVTPGKQE